MKTLAKVKAKVSDTKNYHKLVIKSSKVMGTLYLSKDVDVKDSELGIKIFRIKE